ncbi:MAG: hypothetical protein PHQ86_00950 [Dehalococcoidales bacterium]|nr:hypothetical protein [Dehalococcoidales bacterium]
MKKYLYLYLTIACFLGLIALFVIDGYMGIYENILITSGEQEQKIEPDLWLQKDGVYSTWTNLDENVFFSYEIANRRFSSYSAEIEVSLWQSQEKLFDLVSEDIQIGAFSTGRIEWVVNTEKLNIDDNTLSKSYQYSIIIKREQLERRIILNINGLLPVR